MFSFFCGAAVSVAVEAVTGRTTARKITMVQTYDGVELEIIDDTAKSPIGVTHELLDENSRTDWNSRRSSN